MNTLVLTGLNAPDLFSNTTAFSLFDFSILAPDTTVSLRYDAATSTGLYELTWDLDAPAGFTNTGTFVFSAKFWTADPLDPLAGGRFVAPAEDQTSAYSASAVPEPSTVVLVGLGLGAMVLWRRIR